MDTRSSDLMLVLTGWFRGRSPDCVHALVQAPLCSSPHPSQKKLEVTVDRLIVIVKDAGGCQLYHFSKQTS